MFLIWNSHQDLEFASEMVQKLNLILITSPELAEFRRRLKSLETRVSLLVFSSLALTRYLSVIVA
jgi:hypothetical protein